MESFLTLEYYWNNQIDLIRCTPNIKEWYKGFGNRYSMSFDKTSDGKTIVYQILGGKTLKVSILPFCDGHGKPCYDPKYNRENAAELTRNLPHDIQRNICDKS